MQQKLEIVNNWNLQKLLLELESGKIKIPVFQREYIWEKTKVVKLLNSIYLQYPIGSFFLWIAPSEYSSFINESTDLGFEQKKENGLVQFILDGQQRMISLYVSLKGKFFNEVDYRTICFNPQKKEFLIPRSKREKKNIPIWKLFDSEEYKKVYAELFADDEKFKQRKNRFSDIWHECQQIFSNYPISVVKTSHEELDDVVEIFERINQGGKHLTVFDLIHATTWSEKFDLKLRIKEFNSSVSMKNFSSLSNKVFIFSLTLNAFDDVRSLYQLKLSPELCYKIWSKTKVALNATLNFFKEMRISNNISAYHNFIPIIQYYFFKTGRKVVDEQHRKEIEKWFWDAKFSKRFSTSIYTKLKEDALWITQLIREQ